MQNSPVREEQALRQSAIPIEAIVFLLVGLMSARVFSEPQLMPLLNNGGISFFPSMTRPELLLDLFVMSIFLWLAFGHRSIDTKVAARRFWIIAGSTLLIILFLLCWRMVVRLSNEPAEATHDGILHAEIATREFLSGNNPYAISYEDTLLKEVAWESVPASNNLLTHFVYPPAVLFATMPTIWFFDAFRLPVEVQYIFLVVLGFAGWALLKQIPSWSERSIAFLVTIGNPFIYGYPLAGYNDGLMAGLLVLGAVSLVNRRWVASGVLIGLALAAKQTAWFFVPLLGPMLWAWWRHGPPMIRKGIQQFLIWMVIITGALYLPFLIWSVSDFYRDLIQFPAGNIPGSYPIGGSNFWQFKVWADPNHYVFHETQASWLQLIAALIGFIVTGRWLWRQPRVGTWLMFSATTLLMVGLVSRFNSENYFSALTFIILAGHIIDRYHLEPTLPVSQQAKPPST